MPEGKGGGRRVHLLPVAPPVGTEEVETLDSSKEALCRGLKDGFAAAWDALAPEGLAEEYPGMAIASQLFDGDVSAFDEAWQRFSTLFAPSPGQEEEEQQAQQAAA